MALFSSECLQALLGTLIVLNEIGDGDACLKRSQIVILCRSEERLQPAVGLSDMPTDAWESVCGLQGSIDDSLVGSLGRYDMEPILSEVLGLMVLWWIQFGILDHWREVLVVFWWILWWRLSRL